jgi:ABC-type phosphate transport system substrate-binding protein
MNKHKAIFWSLVAAGIMEGLAVMATPTWAGDGEPIAIIVNASNPVSNLSAAEVRKLFLSERSRWETGKAVAPIMVAAGGAGRAEFLKVVCGMNDGEFNKYFLQAAFTGKDVTPPKEVNSARDVKSVVAGSPGAIGFVRASELSTGDNGIKAVKVDGVAVSEPGYKIK